MIKRNVIYIFIILLFSYSCSTTYKVNKSIVFSLWHEIHKERNVIEESIIVTKKNKKSYNVNIKFCYPWLFSFDTIIVVRSDFIKKIDGLDSIISTYQTYENVNYYPFRFFSRYRISYQGINKKTINSKWLFFAHKYLFCENDLVNYTCACFALLIPGEYRERFFKSSD